MMKKVESIRVRQAKKIDPNNRYIRLIERFEIPFEERSESVIQNLKQLEGKRN